MNPKKNQREKLKQKQLKVKKKQWKNLLRGFSGLEALMGVLRKNSHIIFKKVC